MEVDLQRKRIALSLKTRPDLSPRGERGGSRGAEAGKRDVQRFQERKPQQAAPSFDWFTAAQQKK